MYGGEYFADRMHGFGVYHFANGHRYEGGWHEGRRQGFGMYTFRNGDTQSGHWEDGLLSISTPQDNVKVVKAIQVHFKFGLLNDLLSGCFEINDGFNNGFVFVSF